LLFNLVFFIIFPSALEGLRKEWQRRAEVILRRQQQRQSASN